MQSASPSQPPPAVAPARRIDSPRRFVASRLERLHSLELEAALLAAIRTQLNSVQWFEGDAVPTCACGSTCCDAVDGAEYWTLAGVACCGLLCVAYRLLWAHHPEQDQSEASVDLVLSTIAEHFLECLRAVRA